MNKIVKTFLFAFLISFGLAVLKTDVQFLDPDDSGVSKALSRSDNSIFFQAQHPETGQDILIQHGTQYPIKRDPIQGLNDYLPPPPPNFAIGVTPMHMTYQYITYPRRIDTPLNLYEHPKVHVPQYGLDHPMNMHHPFNNVFGMQSTMYTGAPAANQFLFMNPQLYGQVDTREIYNRSRVNTFPPGTVVPASKNHDDYRQLMARQISPGFDPMMAGVGPYGGGMGAFNPSMTPMGPWFYLSPFNSGS